MRDLVRNDSRKLYIRNIINTIADYRATEGRDKKIKRCTNKEG